MLLYLIACEGVCAVRTEQGDAAVLQDFCVPVSVGVHFVHGSGSRRLKSHGDIVFEASVLDDIIANENSCMKISSTTALPEKDFKAVVKNGKVEAVGVEFFDSAFEAQALYKLNREDWAVWLGKICEYCEAGNTGVYAEKALNEVTDKCVIEACDVRERLCTEVDTPEDLRQAADLIDQDH